MEIGDRIAEIMTLPKAITEGCYITERGDVTGQAIYEAFQQAMNELKKEGKI